MEWPKILEQSKFFFFSIFIINDFGGKFEVSDFFLCVCSIVIAGKSQGRSQKWPKERVLRVRQPSEVVS